MSEIKVPCLPNDTVYIILKHISGVYDIFETTVTSVNVLAYDDKTVAKIDVMFPYEIIDAMSKHLSYELKDINNTLFLTLDNAKKKLRNKKNFRVYLMNTEQENVNENNTK